jgi:CubicO group peptidase (beta-lactamase class C family)
MEMDDPACKYIPAWRDDPLKRRITIRHLATHSSGIEDAELSQLDRAKAPCSRHDPERSPYGIAGLEGRLLGVLRIQLL